MLNIQTGGALAIISAFAASDAAARYLDQYPASEWAWYLNLEIFRSLELARAAITPLNLFFGPWSLWVNIALLVVLLLVRILELRFWVAFFANMSFALASMLAYAWLQGAAAPNTASLDLFIARPASEAFLVLFLLAACLSGFLLSHLMFLTAIRSAGDDSRSGP